MKEYTKGTKFIVCSRDELIEKGWYKTDFWSAGASPNPSSSLSHDDFPGDTVNDDMLSKCDEFLTVDYLLPGKTGWYTVTENSFNWPVATFLESNKEPEINAHVCEEGVTPIDGWFICKFCGTDLKEIK